MKFGKIINGIMSGIRTDEKCTKIEKRKKPYK
jgi:hypothetical protein